MVPVVNTYNSNGSMEEANIIQSLETFCPLLVFARNSILYFYFRQHTPFIHLNLLLPFIPTSWLTPVGGGIVFNGAEKAEPAVTYGSPNVLT